MPLKVKIIHIYIYHLMYKHLYNMTLNLDVAFLLSVSILNTALAKNHAKPAKGDTSHVTKMNIFCFSQLIMS